VAGLQRGSIRRQNRRVPSSLEPYALALLQEGPWYKGGACPQPDISGCGECRTALKGSALEIIGNRRTDVAAMHGNTIVARCALSPSTPRA